MSELLHHVYGLRTGSHMLDDRLRSFVHEDSLLSDVQAIDEDDEKKAWLTIELLSFASLDPLTGNKPSDFFSIHDSEIGFHPYLHTVVNPVGIFSLPRGSELSGRVIAAIEANLSSRMFRAACMLRGSIKRFRELAQKRYSRRAMIAFHRARTDYPGDREAADRAYDEVIKPLGDRFMSRVHRLNEVATPGLNQGWTPWFANFLYRSLPRWSYAAS